MTRLSTEQLRVHFVTGTPHSPIDDGSVEEIVDTARAAALGGAGVIQVRSKPITARQLFHLAAAIGEAIKGTDALLLIDDHVDVALALRAAGHTIDGVHLGQDDLPVDLARELLGPEAVIGLTTGTLELVQATHPVAEHIDYIGAGPFRRTPTKDSGRSPLGLEGYPPLVAESPVPVIAIGDVRAEDAPQLAATGVAGVAVVRGIMNAQDPAKYVGQILQGFDGTHSRSDSSQELGTGGQQ